MAFIALFGSCQKDSFSDTQDMALESAEKNHHAEFLNKQKAEGKISVRSGGKYSVSDAIEALDEGMNYLYCRPSDYFLETVVFKDTFTVTVDGSNEIDETDLLNLMDEIAEFAGDHYHADLRTDKEPLLFDMRQVFPSASGTVRIEAVFAMEAGMPGGPMDEYPYEDSWIYGQWGQDVSASCSTEGANADAADLFRRDLRKNVTYRNKFEAYYFRNPYVYCFSPLNNDCVAVEIPLNFPINESYYGFDVINGNDITNEDNFYEFLLFYNYSGYPDYHTCISIDEMNFHYESMEDLALGVLPSPAGNNVIAQIEVGYDGIFSGNSTVLHSMMVIKAEKFVIEVIEDIDAIILPCCP